MKIFSLFFCTFCLAASSLAAGAAEVQVPVVNDTLLTSALDSVRAAGRRPRIGLTFAGGGAKGAAHIGVLKVLEEVGIPIDYVTGTSMGSIIGALYSLGYSAEQMDSIISGMDWSLFLSDKMLRRGMSSRQKEDDAKYNLNIPFNTGRKLYRTMERIADENRQGRKTMREERKKDGGSGLSFISSLPGGFIEGSNLLNLFNCLSVGYQEPMSFDDLPIPFACVAADVNSGKEVVLREGRLPDAIRASMAIPGVFSPVPYGDMLLVDGGMFNNFPVKVCQDMGADIVIGVEVAKDKDETASINSLPELLGRLFDIVTRGNIDENREACTIYINPDMTGFGTLSFDNASIRTLIGRGYEAADAQRDLLMALKTELDRLGAPEHTVYHAPGARNLTQFSPTKVEISDVRVNGVAERDAEWLKKKSGLRGAGVLDGKALNKAVSICYGTGAFKNIRYYLTPQDDGRYLLTLNAEHSEPNLFSSGIRFDTEDAASVLLRLGLNRNRLNGLKFDFSTRLSISPWARAVLSWSPRVFPTINLAATVNWTDTYMGETGKKDYSMRYLNCGLDFYLSEYHSRNWKLAGGLRIETNRLSDFMIVAEPDIEVQYELLDKISIISPFGLFADAAFDNLDNAYFATRGLKFRVQTDWRLRLFHIDIGDNSEYTESLQLDFESYIPMGRKFCLIPQFYGRYIQTDSYDMITTMFTLQNFMGGSYIGRYIRQQQPFIGLRTAQVTYPLNTIFRCDARWNFYGKHYLYGLFNFCRTATGPGDYFREDERDGHYCNDFFGAGLKYSYDTFLGPFCVLVTWTDMTLNKGFFNNLGLYLQLGYEF